VPDDLRLAQEWTAEGVTTLGQGSQRVPVARIAAREGRTVVIQDTDLDERLHADPMAKGDLQESRSRSVIACPISIAGKLVGVLILTQTVKPRVWTADEVRLVEAITHELRAAMEAARLFQARQRENERMLALHHASAVLAGQTDPRVILEEILKNAVRLLGLGGASLYIYVPEAKILRNIRDYQVRETATEKMLRPGKGMAGTAFERLAPVIQNDYLAWEGATAASKAAGQRAAIAVPLVRSGEPIGSIVVRSYDPAIRFTDEDGHLLTLFADQAVSALTAAEAFEHQRAAVEELERLSKAKSDFISIVSHEFRTPLTGIQGFSEMMRDEDLTPAEIREFAGDINKDAQRLNRMITDMLDLDRMESGRMVLHREAVDINAVVGDVADRVRPNSPRHPIELDLDPTLPEFSGDRDKLTQVVANLLNNSVKYSPDGGQIAITTRAGPGFVQVAIEDHGLGIPEDALERVFERYSRIDSSATRHIQGTGLGLPIVRQIVEMHGGRVWVESVVGKGSTFRFTVPLAAVPQAV
jgi:signal transduction histidine kinase